jgi:hypothetical protein
MSDKLQFVAGSPEQDSLGALDKLKFVGHLALQPVTHFSPPELLINVVQILQTQGHIGIQIEACAFASL